MMNTHKHFYTKSLFLFRNPGYAPASPTAGAVHPAKRAVFRTLRAASLTVEAAFALPLFFLAVISLTGILCLYGSAMRETLALRDRAETAALAAEYAGGDGYVTLTSTVTSGIAYTPADTGLLRAVCKARVRVWSGRDSAAGNDGQEETGEYVYVTDYRSVYHTDPGCTHLELTVHAVYGGTVSGLTNAYGAHYHSCDKCARGGEPSGIVYITEYGDCYHNMESCSGLTRSMYMIPASEAEGLPCCSRCAARDAARKAA